MYLLDTNDFDSIFSSSLLYEKKSFYVIDPQSKTYQTDLIFDSHLKYAQFIKNNYKSGRTIIVKNLENFSYKIKRETLKHGTLVDVHMYLVPPKGKDSFPFHKDDTDVVVTMIYGEKKFEIKKNDVIEEHYLREGDSLFLNKNFEHRAIPINDSCLLSFGITNEISYPIPDGISHTDMSPLK